MTPPETTVDDDPYLQSLKDEMIKDSDKRNAAAAAGRESVPVVMDLNTARCINLFFVCRLFVVLSFVRLFSVQCEGRNWW